MRFKATLGKFGQNAVRFKATYGEKGDIQVNYMLVNMLQLIFGFPLF